MTDLLTLECIDLGRGPAPALLADFLRFFDFLEAFLFLLREGLETGFRLLELSAKLGDLLNFLLDFVLRRHQLRARALQLFRVGACQLLRSSFEVPILLF